MAAISLGGEAYTLAIRYVSIEVIGVAIFTVSFLCMFVPVACGIWGGAASSNCFRKCTGFRDSMCIYMCISITCVHLVRLP